mmetsp:Transcript_94704/g.203370  ORF Transcript_94704/g.203370 Transcript_94704/m.203370 type:complete len:142 (+) Transcript_94704:587-1012(+)
MHPLPPQLHCMQQPQQHVSGFTMYTGSPPSEYLSLGTQRLMSQMYLDSEPSGVPSGVIVSTFGSRQQHGQLTEPFSPFISKDTGNPQGFLKLTIGVPPGSPPALTFISNGLPSRQHNRQQQLDSSIAYMMSGSFIAASLTL